MRRASSFSRRAKIIRKHFRTCQDVFPHAALQFRFAIGSRHSEHNARRFLVLLSALQNALNRRLGLDCCPDSSATVFVRVARFCADLGFVCFHLSRKLAERTVLHCQPNTMPQEPSGLLRHVKRTMQSASGTYSMVICAKSIWPVTGPGEVKLRENHATTLRSSSCVARRDRHRQDIARPRARSKTARP